MPASMTSVFVSSKRATKEPTMKPIKAPMSNCRALHLGGDQWAFTHELSGLVDGCCGMLCRDANSETHRSQHHRDGIVDAGFKLQQIQHPLGRPAWPPVAMITAEASVLQTMAPTNNVIAPSRHTDRQELDWQFLQHHHQQQGRERGAQQRQTQPWTRHAAHLLPSWC